MLRASPCERKAKDFKSNTTNDEDDTSRAHDPSAEPKPSGKSLNSRVISGHAIRRLKLSESPVENSDDETGKPMTRDIDSIVKSMTALDLVPRSVRFRKR